MTNFEKALEAAIKKCDEDKDGYIQNRFSAMEDAARWARQFTIDEIVEFLNSQGYETDHANNFADEIKHRFKDSDRKMSNG